MCSMKTAAVAASALVAALQCGQAVARPGDARPSETKDSSGRQGDPRVPDAIQIVPIPSSAASGVNRRDQYWQLYLEPGVGYDVASAEKRQSFWQRLLSSFWSTSESASVLMQLVLAPGTPGSPTPERPIVLMTKKNGFLDESTRVKPAALTGYFSWLPDPSARLDVALGYSKGVDEKLFSKGLKLIELVGPVLGMPAKWVTVAASDATKTLGDQVDKKLSSLLTTSTPAIATMPFRIGDVEAFEIRTLGENPETLARIKVNRRDTLLAAALEDFPKDDPSQILRIPAPSGLQTSPSPLLRDVAERVVGGRSTDTGPQFDASCKLIEDRLGQEGYNAVDRAAVLAAWLADRGYNGSWQNRTGAVRGCEERLKPLANTSLRELITPKDDLVEQQATDTSRLDQGRRVRLEKLYNKLAGALSTKVPDQLVGLAGLTLGLRADFDWPVLVKSFDVSKSKTDVVEVGVEDLLEVFTDQVRYVPSLVPKCFGLVSDASPQFVRCKCLQIGGEQVFARLTFSGPAWDPLSKLKEIRFQRPGMGS